MKRCLSGVKPTGVLHIGNYFGAIKQFIELQHEYDGYYFIADYHTLNTHPNPADLVENSYSIAADYLALGLEPTKSTIFLQSAVPEHTELTFILSNVITVPHLMRAHAYKDSIAKNLTPNVGLFMYPVLMAVDILIYDSEVVPIGQDQKQHLEITREIAEKFNAIYGEHFTIPEERVLENVAIVPGTDGGKMSKSKGNTIEMFAPEKKLKKQIMGIQTDSTPLEEPKDADACNVFALYKLLASESDVKIMRENYEKGGYGYGSAKKELLGVVLSYFKEAREKREELLKERSYLEKVLKEGSTKAREYASAKTKEIKEAVGLCGNIY